MKKSIFKICALALCIFTMPLFAAEPVFTRYYRNNGNGLFGQRLYDVSEYLNGNYRTNFVNIPQNRMLNNLNGFDGKVGVFELEGTPLYLGWWKEANGYLRLKLIDEKNNNYIDYKNQEISYFSYTDSTGTGIVTEINLNGKKYTIAVAGLSSNKAGVYTDYDGFRMWVENEAAKDAAQSKKGDLHYTQNGKDKTESVLCYEWDDVFEGVYKAGWKRLFGTVAGQTELNSYMLNKFKYTYKDTEFICDWSKDYTKGLVNPDGSEIPYKNFQYFSLWGVDEKGNKMPGWCSGIEGDVEIGNNKVRIAVLSGDEKKRVFVKDTSGYPVLSKAAPVKVNGKKTEKAKKSGKAANFTRNYEKYSRVYSKQDISKGLYKANFKNIPQSDSKEMRFTSTAKDGTKSELTIKNGVFDLENYKIHIYNLPGYGWMIAPDKPEGKESWSLSNKKSFMIEGTEFSGTEANIIRNDEIIATAAMVAFDTANGDYRLFIKKGPDEEIALSEKDNFGIEYYDVVDIISGIYKPGFELIDRRIDNDKSHEALFENASDNNPPLIYDYKGYKFLIGDSQDPANNVKNLDGSVIYNPETQLRFIIPGKNNDFHCYQGVSYGWEGKVRLGDKDVILAFIKWGSLSCAFVKE